MVNVLGLDIGGANTKAAFLKTQDATMQELRTVIKYFPIWKKGKKQLPKVLEKLKEVLVDFALNGVGVTITAEVSDIYWTKKEGIDHVLDSVSEVFGDVPTFILDVEANLLPTKDARGEPLRVASANWAATGWMISQQIKNCIIVDVGSTTTSIIPVINGKIAAEGRTDLEKLKNGELVYSGSLRTNVSAIVSGIPVRGVVARVSSELFAQSGDVHLILGNIEEEEYIAETCDRRGKTIMEAMARLARVVCGDLDVLTQQEIRNMAKFVYDKQVEQISEGLKQVYERIKKNLQEKIVVVTGLGRNFLARKAAKKAGFSKIIDMREMLGAEASVVSPAVGVALAVASRLEGKRVRWKQF
ncbi:MAG: H4MPT-linked C1 transfer pathway protein [Candidatus Bathyarchaeota archaeon]|nr:H4MPT-linked C1 transfer pathway protein [Candidatus Bathyarchaeota archaeon]